MIHFSSPLKIPHNAPAKNQLAKPEHKTVGESGYSSVTFSFIVHSSDTCHAEKPETWPRIG